VVKVLGDIFITPKDTNKNRIVGRVGGIVLFFFVIENVFITL
jgi:hypothetical protein